MVDPNTGDRAASERRSRLLGIKLRALAADHLGVEPDETWDVGVFPGGAALVAGDGAWVLVDGPAARRLGAALAWALGAGAESLDLVVESDAGVVARRATQLTFPVRVWFAEGRALLPAIAEPPAPPPAPPADHLAFVDMIEAAGATPIVEQGVVTGEVRGLEVCRVVAEPTVGRFAELSDVALTIADVPDRDDVAARLDERRSAGVVLEVGVGPADREAFQLLHGDVPTVDALAAVVESVTAYRTRDVVQHPLNRFAKERFLRWELEQDPGRLGLAEVVPADPPVPRPSIKEPAPCLALGRRADGTDVDVVVTSGVDLDLVPFVADVLARQGATGVERPVLVAAPSRDLVAPTRRLNELLRRPAELVDLG